jgi:hypothetical protein
MYSDLSKIFFGIEFYDYTGQQIKKMVYVMNRLLRHLFVSMKLEKGHKNYLVLVLKLCYYCDMLQNRLKFYTERRIK